MVDREVLRDIKNNILKFEYPLANTMSDEELADIFNASNRPFLMAWMIKLLGIYSEEYVTPDNPQLLRQILHENGFCKKDQLESFMKASMCATEQFQILQSMFMYIKMIKKPKIDKDFKELTMADVDDLFKNNINLFPQYGEIKILTQDQPVSSEIQIKISSPVSPQNQPTNVEEETVQASSEGSLEKHNDIDTNKLIEDMRLYLPKIKNVGKDCQNGEDKGNDILLRKGDELQEIVEKASGYIEKVNQFLDDIKTIEDFFKHNEEWLEEPEIKAQHLGYCDLLRGVHIELLDIKSVYTVNK